MLLPGHRLLPSPPSVPPAIIADFAAAQVAVASDNLNRLHGTRALRPYHGKRLIGTAVTVKTRPGDNMTCTRHSLASSWRRPGRRRRWRFQQGLVGEIMMSRAKAMGVAGFVIDGAIRDVGASRLDFPCFARGVTHRGPYKTVRERSMSRSQSTGWWSCRVTLSSATKMVCSLLTARRERALGRVRKQEAREAGALEAIAEGRLDNPYIGVSASI